MYYSKVLFKGLLILTTTSFILSPPISALDISDLKIAPSDEAPWESMQKGQLITYDAVINVLKKIESDDWENSCSEEELRKTIRFITLLAREGILPGETDEEQLEADIQELLSPEVGFNDYNYVISCGDDDDLIPAIYRSNGTSIILCKSWVKKQFHQVKKFAKHHKKAVIIGTVVVVAAVTVVGVAALAPSAAAAGAGMAEAKRDEKKQQKASEKEIPPQSSECLPADPSLALKSAFQGEVASFKDIVTKQQLIQAQDFSFPAEENGRVLGQAFTEQSLDHMAAQDVPFFSQSKGKETNTFASHQIADNIFHPSDETRSIPTEASKMDLATNMHQLRGERAFELKHYDQAIFDFEKVIEQNPHQTNAYLERATAHFHKGDYKSSLEDYHTYIAHKEAPTTQVIDFSCSFAKGLARGAKDSGRGFLSFASDVLSHPIDTGKEVWEACSILCELARDKEWETIGQAFSPEIHKVITEWTILSSKERGELAGYAFGKLGTDIIIPGASTKIVCSGVKGTKELVAAINALKNAEKTLVLETLAEVTSQSQSVAEAGAYFRAAESAVLPSEKTATLSTIEGVLSEQARSASIAKFNYAETFLEPYCKSFLSETQVRELIYQTGIQTFPRPASIPENFIVRITDRGAGMEYMHPTNPHISVRIMPGKPHSPNPSQQKPYVIQKKNGKAFDKHGNLISLKATEAHISIEEFIYRE